MGVAFQPRFILPSELSAYGLGSGACDPNNTSLLNLVDTASTLIDQYCGRTDGDGNGSLVYTTYVERLTSQAPGRNLYVIPHRPLVAVTASQILALSGQNIASGDYFLNEGLLPAINVLADGTLSSIIACSGRYIPGRRSEYGFNDEPGSFINPFNTSTLFGGPTPWNPIDMTNLDYNTKTGVLWVAAGLYMYTYSEIIVTYTSGYDPNCLPKALKRATAAVTKNLMAKGGGTTGMTKFTSTKIGAAAEFTEDVIDLNVQRLLTAYMTVRAT